MKFNTFDNNTLEAICKILGDTVYGLTGSQICDVLNRLNISDPYPTLTKWKRLFESLSLKQNEDKCGNYIIAFIKEAMQPVRYINALDNYESQRIKLNTVLSFKGLELLNDGNIRTVVQASTINQAQARANNLRKILIDRNVHGDVLKFCKAELISDNYFHAVFEATKSVADKIRTKTSLTEDGSILVDKSFGIKCPLLAINSLQTETEQSEQKGFINLLKGIFSIFRNVTAHEPKIKWSINEQDALDLLTMVSYVHRKLDLAVSTGNKPML